MKKKKNDNNNKTMTEKSTPIELDRSSSSALPEGALFLITAVSIIFFGLIVLYSTSFSVYGYSFFQKQMIWMTLGLFAFPVILFVGYRMLSDYSVLLLYICGLLLIWALFSRPIKGAYRWVSFAGFTLQPSEYVKVTLVLFLAWFYANRTRAIEHAPLLKVFLPAGLIAGPVIALVLLGRDLGTTILLGTVFLAMSFVAGIPLRYILPFIVGLPPLAVLIILKFDPERSSRIISFLDPENCQSADGYQLWNSLLALGSGNWFGIGFTESRLKLKYLPEAHTDFILSIVGEELGFVAVTSVIVSYLLLAFFGFRIASKARTRQGMLVAFGMCTYITLQAIINLGVICGALPTKGMPAPMISYGGSSLLACMIAVAIVFCVALDNTYPKYDELLHRKLPFFSGKDRKKN
ncbi:MAG: cell division protein FtsW [Lentisphaeria bacterium]|nr:cell division protein FtsW [Lentisphaeria bacterium]